jgi:hypothetical protein
MTVESNEGVGKFKLCEFGGNACGMLSFGRVHAISALASRFRFHCVPGLGLHGPRVSLHENDDVSHRRKIAQKLICYYIIPQSFA